jgi:2-amino-4-hydroxy-6-hydroxymethyldihydropteridine diphosphokinase
LPVPAFVSAAIALGSNVGDRARHLGSALDAIVSIPRTELRAASRIFETMPVGPIPQGRYLNSAAILSTSLSPHALLDALHSIERSLGRDREAGQRWGPRTIDLDLLVHGEAVVEGPELTLPHPRLRERAFVLIPLASVAPDLVIPASDAGPEQTVAQALAVLEASGGVVPGACILYEPE